MSLTDPRERRDETIGDRRLPPAAHSGVEHSGKKEALAVLAEFGEAGVVIPDLEDVISYLVKYPALVSDLPAYLKIGQAAGHRGAQLSLEKYRDPEIEDDHLVLYIRQEAYDNTLLDRIDQAYEDIPTESNCGSPGWILVTTDFGPPR